MANSVTFTWKLADRFSAAARGIRRTVETTQRSVQRLGAASTAAGKRMTKMGNEIRGASLASSLAVAGSVKAFADMEKGVTNVLTLLDDPAEVQKFRGEFNQLSEDAVRMGFSIQDSNKALFDTVSALGAGEKANGAFREAQTLAIGGVTDLSVAVDGITSAVNAYAQDNLKAKDAANAFFSAQQKGKTTVAELASNIGKVAPIAAQAGVGLNELLAVSAQLTLGGLSTDEATTALRQAIAALIKPGKDAAKILTALGVPFGTQQIKAEGLTNVLRKLREASEKYPGALERAIPNIRAFTAVAALNADALDNAEAIQAKINQDIANNTGLTQAAAAQMETFSFQMGQTFGEVKILAAQIGEALAPALKVIGFLVRGLSRGFSVLDKVTKSIIATLLVVVAVAAPILLFFGKLGIVVGAIAGTIGASFAAVGIAVAAVVAAIIAAIGLLIFKFDTVKEKFTQGVGAVKRFFGFGDEDLNVTGSGEINQNARLDVNVGVRGPKGTIESVKSKTTGRITGLNTGVALEEGL